MNQNLNINYQHDKQLETIHSWLSTIERQKPTDWPELRVKLQEMGFNGFPNTSAFLDSFYGVRLPPKQFGVQHTDICFNPPIGRHSYMRFGVFRMTRSFCFPEQTHFKLVSRAKLKSTPAQNLYIHVSAEVESYNRFLELSDRHNIYVDPIGYCKLVADKWYRNLYTMLYMTRNNTFVCTDFDFTYFTEVDTFEQLITDNIFWGFTAVENDLGCPD